MSQFHPSVSTNLSTAASYQRHTGKQRADIFPSVIFATWKKNSSKGVSGGSAMLGFIYGIYLEQ